MKAYRVTAEYLDDAHILRRIGFTVSANSIEEAFVLAEAEIVRLSNIAGKEYILRSVEEK